MTPRIRLLVWAVIWAGATFGVLSIERLPGDYEHDFCGPWGCLPRLQALAAMHGFWVMLLIPPAAWLIARAPPRRLRLAGEIALWAGVFGLVVVTARGLSGWLEATELRRYAAQRALYVVLTATDLPFVQFTLVGAVLWLVGRRKTQQSAGRLPERVAGSEESSLPTAQNELSTGHSPEEEKSPESYWHG